MPNYDLQNLVEHFQFVGLNPGDAELAKCLELCITYKISEEELVEVWVAFAISNLKNDPPSLEGLNLLERRELSKSKNNLAASTVVVHTPERQKPKTNFRNSPSVTKTQLNQSLTQTFDESISQDISVEISSSQVGNYADRENSGQVALSYGEKTQYSRGFCPVPVKLFGDESQWMPPLIEQMYCGIHKHRQSQAEITHHIANLIARKHNITLEQSQLEQESSEGTYYGTIMCGGEGKLNKTSALLELPGGAHSNGDKIRLNLSQMKSCALFPGQVAVVQGKFMKGTLQVTNLFNDAFIRPVQKLESGSLQIMIAAGPFTIKSNIAYDPLQDLLHTAVKEHPDVLILTGPFLDEDHDKIDSMTDAFDTYFASLIESIMTPLDMSNIQVVLVSSLRDVHHFPVYPTPPYTTEKYPNFMCVSDPCMLDIYGVHIGITTADILFHIGKEEYAYGSGASDRMTRLCQYLLGQMSFYPLQSAENMLPIDYGFMERFGLMETSPHLLITPSNFRHFVKNISGCTVINPERLVKGYAGGTYARIQITTSKELKIFCEITQV